MDGSAADPKVALKLDGGPGNDRLIGGGESAVLTGGPGADQFFSVRGSNTTTDLNTADGDTASETPAGKPITQ